MQYSKKYRNICNLNSYFFIAKMVWHLHLKGQFSQNLKYILFLLPVVLFINLDYFGDIGRRDFCLLSNFMGVNGALIVMLTTPKNAFEKLNSNIS